jgi:hypothetical protein
MDWQRLGMVPPRNELRHYVFNGHHIGLPEDLGDLILKEHEELHGIKTTGGNSERPVSALQAAAGDSGSQRSSDEERQAGISGPMCRLRGKDLQNR